MSSPVLTGICQEMFGVVCSDRLDITFPSLHNHNLAYSAQTLGSFTPSPGNILLVLLLPDADAGDTKFEHCSGELSSQSQKYPG